MSEFKGTKGKWELKDTPTLNCKSLKSLSGEYIAMLSLNVVRPALMSSQKPINEANAKLITHAPELLEMVKLLVDRLEENGLGEFSAVSRAKELIKSATE